MAEYVHCGEEPMNYTNLIKIFNYINEGVEKIWTFDKDN